MSQVTFIWALIIGACVTMALPPLLIGLKNGAWANMFGANRAAVVHQRKRAAGKRRSSELGDSHQRVLGMCGLLFTLQSCETRRARCGPSLLIAMAVALALIFTVKASAAEPKRVLVVHSFGSVAPPFTTHSIAFETELVEKMGERVDLDEVSVDMARYADPNLQEALVEYLQKRHAHWQPDLVVPIGSPAGVFVEQYRDRLFPETPILYTGMDRRRLAPNALDKNAAFVGENFNLPGFIEDILQVAPATKNIAVVIGASPVEQYWAAAFRKEFEPFANHIKFIWLNDLSFDQMVEKTRTLPPDSYIFLIMLLRDATGVTHNADEALRRIHAVANAPINGIYQHQLGLGIVGGRLYQAELEGIESARIAVRILHGERASNFSPKIVDPLPPCYDWRELQRWKIDEKLLPPASTVLFREPTVWDRYWAWITAGVSICILQGLLITGLVANLVKRHRAERSLTESEQRFRRLVELMPVAVYVCDTSGIIQSCNKRAVELWGRAPKLGDTAQLYCGSLRLYSPDGKLVPHEKSPMAEVLKTGVQACDVEMVMERPDGSRITVLANIAPLRNADGEVIGAMNCFQDITERKQAEEKLKATSEQLRALSARLQSVREEEATRIAREIHDELGQKLTGLKMDLRRAERKLEELEGSPAVNTVLDTIVSTTELADEMIAAVQEIAANLRPGVLDKLGLGAALHYEARRFQERTGIRCNMRLPEAEPTFSKEVSTALFRIFQECLTNVARHANASEVEAELKRKPGSVILSVHDNGRGITPTEMMKSESLGLLGMKERAALLGGEVLFEHGPKGGTLVTVRIAQTTVTAQSYQLV